MTSGPSTAPRNIVKPASGRDGSAAQATEWDQRAGRLYTDLERPARAMVRRAFRGAFSEDELDDIYAAAWVGTLRALSHRHAELSNEEIRRYLLAAVANQASKELRRRRRRPTAPLELVDAVADDTGAPDERAVGAERSRMARDLLASLPPRRRAVMLLRYGWGLEPRQVCELVKLSPRAYRREITRGVDEMADRMGRMERGEWCDDRGTVLKAYAAGLADVDERRQAEAHLAHCRACTDFVAGLRAHLHDLGSGMALPVAFEALHGGAPLSGRIAEVGERAREAMGSVLHRGAEGLPESVGSFAAGGGSRGMTGAAGAGMLAKLTQLGTAGKVAVACLAGGAAATCVGTGAVPGLGPAGAAGDRERAASLEPGDDPAEPTDAVAVPVVDEGPGSGSDLDASSGDQADGGSSGDSSLEQAAPPPAELEFDAVAAGSRSRSGGGSSPDAGSGGGSSGGSTGGEFQLGTSPGGGGGGASSGGGNGTSSGGGGGGGGSSSGEGEFGGP